MAATLIKGKHPEYTKFYKNADEDNIPFDVTFVIMDSEGNDKTEDDTKIAKTVKAHKHMLAFHSDIFKRMFFGPLKETKNRILIKETTFEAFEKLIEYIYQVDIECKNLTLVELYDIVNLAEKYNMPNLMEELKTQIKNTPLTIQNLMDVVDIASTFSHFEEVFQALMLSCAKFFKENVGLEADMLKFVDKYAKGREMLAFKLVSMVPGLPNGECSLVRTVGLPKCRNCGEEKCMTGQPVLFENMCRGLKVKPNNAANHQTGQYYWGHPWHLVREDKFIIKNVQAPFRVKLNHIEYHVDRWHAAVYHGIPTMRYDC